jgi:hypothetical protein
MNRGRKALVDSATSLDDQDMTGPTTHTCPYCELIFSYHNEVKDHILHDHPEHRDVVDSIEPREMPHG